MTLLTGQMCSSVLRQVDKAAKHIDTHNLKVRKVAMVSLTGPPPKKSSDCVSVCVRVFMCVLHVCVEKVGLYRSLCVNLQTCRWVSCTDRPLCVEVLWGVLYAVCLLCFDACVVN